MELHSGSLLFAFALAGAVWLIAVWWRRRRASLRARRRGARAVAGEHDAELILGDLGYDIIDRQVSLSWTIEVNGEPQTINLRADLIVDRDGIRYVAEVKTGEQAPNVTLAATRRQLLEYLIAYDVDGVLLINADTSEVTDVVFPLAETQQGHPKVALRHGS